VDVVGGLLNLHVVALGRRCEVAQGDVGGLVPLVVLSAATVHAHDVDSFE